MAESDLQKTRRRLSVISDNKLVEGQLIDGVDNVTLDEPSPSSAASPKSSTSSPTDSNAGASGGGSAAPSGGFVVNSYGGFSKKGFAPYNPKKKNQDALVMAEDPKTRSLLLCVMDGHGEDGDKVSQNIKGKLAKELFKHRYACYCSSYFVGFCVLFVFECMF
jgi:hypothetical protein